MRVELQNALCYIKVLLLGSDKPYLLLLLKFSRGIFLKDTGRFTFPDSILLKISFVIILVSFLSGCQDALNINSPPKGTINSPAKDIIVVAGGIVNFQGNGSDTDSGNPVSYKWDFSGGATDSTKKDPGIITFKTPGTYKVTFTVTDADGLSDPTPPTVTVKAVHVFVGYDFVSGSEIWMTDGTKEGTKMVKDINPFGGSLAYPKPKLTIVNGTAFFIANDGIHGDELWKSDGTEEGTMMVKDINNGEGAAFASYSTDAYQANEFTSVNGIIFFIANDGTNGNGLWKSDGTETGTIMVKDINPSQILPYSLNDEIINFHGTIFFAEDNGINGSELWKSDGTEAGTIMVKDINPGPGVSNPHNFTEVGGALFFIAYNSTNGFALWKSDGTEEETVMVKVLNSEIYPYPDNLTDVNGILFFVVNDEINGIELWNSDGTEAGTVMVKDINPEGGSNPSDLTNVNGILFFTANDGANGRELWKSDGTEEGTVMVKDITTLGTETSKLQALTTVNDMLYFIASAGTSSDALWMSDGTESGTFMVKDINPDGVSFFQQNPNLMNVNGMLFFLANWGELWKSDGTEEGTVKIMNMNVMAKSSFPSYLANINNILLFEAIDGTETGSGSGLWRSDGTEAGTFLIKGLSINPYNYKFIHVNDTDFFVGGNENGYELWKTDGTEAGTVMVKDINPGSLGSGPADMISVNGILFFTADDGTNGRELWRSDGTEAGTVMVKDIWQGMLFGSDPSHLININGIIFFTADYVANDVLNIGKLWKSDGAEAGTVPVAEDFSIDLYSIIRTGSVNINGTIFFISYDKENGVALWKSDGTSAGTAMVRVILPSAFNFDWNAHIININDSLYFIVYGGADGTELWKSDGTEAGTTKIKDIAFSGSAFFYSYWYQEDLININGTLFFAADDGVNGVELWKSDGTEEGTVMVKDINPGTGNAFYCMPYYKRTCLTKLASNDGAVFFWANDGTHGFELWKSDGTESGTVMVKDTYPGSGGSFFNDYGLLTDFINAGDSIFFTANDGTHGFELWKTDGTEAGTAIVKDINITNQ